MKEYGKIVTGLNRIGIRGKLLARRVDKESKWVEIGKKQFKHKDKTEEKLYNTFLRLVDEETRKRLITLDEGIKKIETTIYEQSGWYRTSSGFRFEDNFQNMQDYEFRTWDTYSIDRSEEGYHIREEKPFNSYFANIQEREMGFLNKYKDLLNQLHVLLTEKEKIMRGNFILKDDSNRELALNISNFLGFIPESKENNLSK